MREPVICGNCGIPMTWNLIMRYYVCPNCGNEWDSEQAILDEIIAQQQYSKQDDFVPPAGLIHDNGW